jgi:hypothetical protein
MQDIIVALYDDHTAAVAARTALVKDGFATDRVEVTSPVEHRQADKGPASDFESNVRAYFDTLYADQGEAQRLKRFAEAVIDGAATVTVHPRGEEEIRRAERILDAQAPREVYRYLPQDSAHVIDRKIERAAAPRTSER